MEIVTHNVLVTDDNMEVKEGEIFYIVDKQKLQLGRHTGRINRDHR